MQVRAWLAGGIAQSAPWGIALDGLLAGMLWADRRAAAREAGVHLAGPSEVGCPEDFDLPLARCDGSGGQGWHWAAGCAFPEQRPHHAPIEVRYWTGRVDQGASGQVAETFPQVVSDRRGRYRARRMPLIVTPCASVVWRAVGDVDGVWDLVSGIWSVGKKRAAGEGRVLRWEVTALDEGADRWAAAHLHPTGDLGRPTPVECLAGRDVPTGGLGCAGLRPPYMHPARQQVLALPVFLDSDPGRL